MTSTTYVSLNLQSPNTAVTVNAKQNDRLSRYIRASLYDGAEVFTPPVGASAAIRYKKPDGTGGFYDVDEDSNPAIVITGSTALLTLAEQCTTVPGDVYMELTFYTVAGDKLTSFTWLLKVEQSVLTDVTIVSSDYYNVLTAQVAQTLEYRDAAAASATSAAASATSAEYWAGIAQGLTAGIKGYFATPSALIAAYPTGENGWWAIVGTTDTIWVWDSDTTAWVDSGDVSYFYTKTESDARFATAAQGALADTAVQPEDLTAANTTISDAGGYFTSTNFEGALQEVAIEQYKNTLSTAGLTYTGCTYIGGGYTKIGNLVVVNIRVSLTAGATHPSLISGLPTPVASNYANYIPVNVQVLLGDCYSGIIYAATGADPIGSLRAYGTFTSGQSMLISAVYVAA